MSTPERMKAVLDAIKIERPWEENAITRQLSQLIPNKEMAEMIWALQRQCSITWVTEPMPALQGDSICSLVHTESGEAKIWAILEAAGMWL